MVGNRRSSNLCCGDGCCLRRRMNLPFSNETMICWISCRDKCWILFAAKNHAMGEHTILFISFGTDCFACWMPLRRWEEERDDNFWLPLLTAQTFTHLYTTSRTTSESAPSTADSGRRGNDVAYDNNGIIHDVVINIKEASSTSSFASLASASSSKNLHTHFNIIIFLMQTSFNWWT